MDNPLLIAVIIGWIVSVCLHEYAHALAAYLSGDRSVAERGYLSMNPLSYIDPVTSLLIPAVILAIGGIPLPGGAVLIDRSALRRRWQASLVSAAGPLANLLLFAGLALLIHPKIGLVDAKLPVSSWPTWAVFVGTMALLQLFAVLLNLLPIPPLDGFQAIEPFLKPSTREQIMLSPIGRFGFLIVVAALLFVPGVNNAFFTAIEAIFEFIGVPWRLPAGCYSLTFFSDG